MNITLEQVATRLKEQDDILILCHRSPDGDTSGSAHGLYLMLKELDKNVMISCADDFPVDMVQFFPIIDQKEFKEKFIVSVDIADTKLLGDLEELYGDKIDLSIDHHPSNTLFAKENYVESTAAAAAEIMGKLPLLLGVKMTVEMATCIYLGMATDTGCFKFSNTTAQTLRIAANLLDAGADNGEINRIMFESKTPGRLAIEGYVINKIQYFFQKKCAMILIPQDLKERFHVDENDLEGLASIPRQIAGVWIGVTIKEKDGLCRVSIRTTKEVDASALCKELGGGGHARAAGCAIQGTLEEAQQRLLEVIEKIIIP